MYRIKVYDRFASAHYLDGYNGKCEALHGHNWKVEVEVQGGFDHGADAVILIGTDIPALNQSIITTAFQVLEKKDIVIGPDTDGGYYLIGTRRKSATLFKDIHWSSEFVFQQTMGLIGSQQLSVAQTPTLSDIDTKSDFQRWYLART